MICILLILKPLWDAYLVTLNLWCVVRANVVLVWHIAIYFMYCSELSYCSILHLLQRFSCNLFFACFRTLPTFFNVIEIIYPTDWKVSDEFCYLVLLDMVRCCMIEVFHVLEAMWHFDEIEEPLKSSNNVLLVGIVFCTILTILHFLHFQYL